MLMHGIEKLNQFFSFTFARFYAGFYCYAPVLTDARM
jgi:hypothetical protein